MERAVSSERSIVPIRVENIMPTGAMEYCLGGTLWFDALRTQPRYSKVLELLE